MFLGSELGGLGEEIWRIGCGDDFVLAEDVLTRAYARSHTGVLFFLLSQVSQWMEFENLFHPKNDESFYAK